MNTFTVTGAFSAGWGIFTRRPWFLIGSGLLVTLVYIIAVSAISEFGKIGAALALLGGIANFVIQTYYKMGVTNFLLKSYDRVEDVKLDDYWRPHPFWNFVLASLAVAASVILAIIGSLAVAGILAGLAYVVAQNAALVVFLVVAALCAIVSIGYIALTLSFVSYIVIARSLSPVESLKESARISKGHRMQILGFGILSILFNIVGAICLIVGVLVTIPVTALAFVHMYRTLEQQASEPMMVV